MKYSKLIFVLSAVSIAVPASFAGGDLKGSCVFPATWWDCVRNSTLFIQEKMHSSLSSLDGFTNEQKKFFLKKYSFDVDTQRNKIVEIAYDVFLSNDEKVLGMAAIVKSLVSVLDKSIEHTKEEIQKKLEEFSRSNKNQLSPSSSGRYSSSPAISSPSSSSSRLLSDID